MSIQQNEATGDLSLDREHIFRLSAYPLDMSSFLSASGDDFDEAGVPYQTNPSGYDPTVIAQYALACWNQYLTTHDEKYCRTFLVQASWFVEHETHIGKDVDGWPVSFSHPDVSTGGSWLSAVTQGKAISVLVRAYQLTGKQELLEVMHRAVRSFERDILDGGVSAPVVGDGIFFEEVAVYPAAHRLTGFLLALFGLYDYVALTGDNQINKLIEHGLATLRRLLGEFDTGFWTRSDLLHWQLSSPMQLTSQIKLLEALAEYAENDFFSDLASRWKSYQYGLTFRLRYRITNCCMRFSQALLKRVRKSFFPPLRMPSAIRACVSVNAFPVLGGIRTVLAGIAQVTGDIWQIEYLTREIGPSAEGFIIHRFGPRRMGPWLFPFVWFYVLAGWWKLLTLMRRGAGYHVFLPQDGVFTAAFMGLVAKLAGVRVVCIDHANLTLLKSRIYRTERIWEFAAKPWTIRLLIRLLYVLYWPSLYILAWIAARCVDHYLIPGVAGDGVEEMCQRLGVQPSRITRFDSMIDIERHTVLDEVARASIREEHGVVADAIVIAVICRLALEKGLDTAVESISQTLSRLSPDQKNRVQVIIAGDGPIREQVEEDIRKHGLSQYCTLWGNISAKEVLSLLSITDIFLNTSTRGTCFPMSILEAMASGCAVVASQEPKGNVHLLAGGRGIAVPPCDPLKTSDALIQLVSDLKRCRLMGQMARNYIVEYHSPAKFRRTLMRMTCWSALDKVLDMGHGESVI